MIAVDDERYALRELSRAIAQVAPEAQTVCFESAAEALAYARETKVDVAFLDINMDEMSGLFLAKQLKEINGKTNIIFVTGYNEYALDAIRMHASGYLMKPIDPELVAREMIDLRHPVEVPDTGIRVQCFGNFEVFMDGKPLDFTRQKTKELLAYLVSRQGAWCDIKEIAAILWEDRCDCASQQSHLRNLTADLKMTLEGVGGGDILLKKKGKMAINPKRFTCDMYDFLNHDIVAINHYHGEFMAQYSWAEFINAYLNKR